MNTYVRQARNWIFRGVLSVVFGLLALAWPGATVAALVLMFGAYALVDGLAALVTAARADSPYRGASAVDGVVGLLAGVLTLIVPHLTALVFFGCIAVWAVTTGIAEMVAAVRLRRVLTGEWLLLTSGILSVAFGVVTVLLPAVGVVAVASLVAFYALASGALLIALGISVRRRSRASGGREGASLRLMAHA